MRFILVLMLLVPVSFMSHAQNPAAVVEQAPAQAQPSKGESILISIEDSVKKIPTSVPAWLLGVIAFLVELSMRLWPSVKPRSIFIFIGSAFHLVGSGFNKIADLLDLVVQNIKS